MQQVIQYQKTGKIIIDELPLPKLIDGGILVQNCFSLISAGTERTSVETAQASIIGKAKLRPDLVLQVKDNLKREGLIATYNKVQNRLDNYKELGYSSAGIVVESSSDRFKPGDCVACGGVDYASHAEYVCVPKNLVAKLPASVSLEEATFTTVGAIALQGVRQADVKLGETIAVIGLGLIGLITVQLLKANGCKVIGLDISENTFELAQKMGCNDCMIIELDSIRKVESFTRGIGVDAVILTAGTKSNEPIEYALKFARKKAKIVIVGSVGLQIPRSPFYEKELDLRISCSYGPGRYDPNYEENGQDYPVGYVRWTENRNMQAILDLIDQNKLDVKSLVTHRFKIEEALQAYELITGQVKERYLGVLIEYPETERHRVTKITHISSNGTQPQTSAGHEPVLGFIGAGNFAQSYLLPPLKKLGLNLKGVVTSRPINAKAAAKKFGFHFCASEAQEILNDDRINTVFIATRHNSHAFYVIEALKKNKNVFVEKPLAINELELNEIKQVYQEVSEKQNFPPFLMVGYNRRFSEPVKAVKAHYNDRVEPLVIHFRVNAGYIPINHWYQQKEQGGRIIGEVCHFVDTMQFLTGSVPVEVYANCAADPGERYVLDNVIMSLKFGDGSIGSITYVANGSPALAKENLEVFCEGKSAVMNDFKGIVFYKDRKKWKKKYAGAKGHFEEMQMVVECIKSGSPAPINFESLLLTSLTTFRALESLKDDEKKQIEL